MANSSDNKTTYAIDFGTSNTVITRWNAVTEQAETIKLDGLSQQIANNPPLIPSLVYIKDGSQGQIISGQAVRDRGLDVSSNSRFFRGFKRGIGAEIQGFLPEIDGITPTFEQIGQWFLADIIARLTASEPNFNSLVLTVPVDSFEAYRYWLTQVCQSLSIEQIRILDEPTAAALGYGAAEKELLLVIDFGGGTIDLSLVQITKQAKSTQGFILKWGKKNLGASSSQRKRTARVLAKAGQNLGGSDIDNWLIDYFVARENIPKSPLTTRLAEKLKIQLSSQTKATEVYFDDENLATYELSLNREQFEQILQEQQFFTQLDELMTQVLNQARRNGVEINDIESVLLVGGTGQIPSVQNWVRQYFPADKILGDRPFEAIAAGALQVAKGIEVRDFLYHSYGIRYWDRKQNRHNWHPIINAGQPYPMARPVELCLGASVENQPSIELIIGELATETAGVEVYFDGDRLVTKKLGSDNTVVKPLNDREGARTLARLNPLGNPGSDRIKLLFSIDDRCYLRVTVEDILTQEILLDNQVLIKLD
ncbi:MAG: Hsp70 family protein [Xenococcaceae cyanobacterium]